jgi:flagellar hook-basal body complex protein FliE
MKEHQTPNQIDAAEVNNFLNQLIRETERVTEAMTWGQDQLRLSDAIEVLKLARQSFQLAVEMIVPYADD